MSSIVGRGPAITVPLLAKAATEPLQPAPAAAAAATAPSPEADAGPAVVEVEPPVEAQAAPEPLEDRVSLARQSELIAAALEGGALEAIEPLPAAPAAPQMAPEHPEPVPAPEAASAAAEPTPVDAVEASTEPVAPPRPADVEAAATPVEPPVEGEAAPSPESEAEIAAVEPAEILTIEVWRPHRHNVHSRRPAERNRGPRRPPNGTAAAAEPGQTPEQGEKSGEREPRRDGKRFGGDRQGEGRPRGPRRDVAARGEGGDERRPRPDYKGGKGGRGNRRDERPRTMSSEPARERERQPDPNSPFAKLAALKAQLEGK